MRLEAGARIRDNLCLENKLGEGAMGEVWCAVHEGLGRRVAVKFLHDDAVTGEPRTFERFRREAIAASQIVSPHVVQIFDAAATDDCRPYIVMELLEGESFGECIENKAPMSFEDVALVVRQVADCLAAAHALGVVHRDIKPDNIFLTRTSSGGVHSKVLDFGIAKVATLADSEVKLTREGNLIGSPAYMSREQIMDSGIVPEQIDLWGLAVCAYEALTGQLPFDGPTVGLVCVSIVQGSFWRPSEHVSSLPAEVDAFFARAFANEPAERFVDAGSFATTFASLGNPARARLAQQDHTSIIPLPPPVKGEGEKPRAARPVVADTQVLKPLLQGAPLLQGQGALDVGNEVPSGSPELVRARKEALLESSASIARQPWTNDSGEPRHRRRRLAGLVLLAATASLATVWLLISTGPAPKTNAAGTASGQAMASVPAPRAKAPQAAPKVAEAAASAAPIASPSTVTPKQPGAAASTGGHASKPAPRFAKPLPKRKVSPEEELGF
jgi:eukaryotic-like serine/threonine-protein kinase